MRKQSKRRRQSKRRKRLKMRAPLMPNLRMTIYNDSNGIETDVACRHYQAVAVFFKKLLGKNGIMPGDPGKPDYVFVETQEQMDAFWNFTAALTRPGYAD
jgi:acetylornithine/succinyldiaminopimelate/putrescine aminotransferase